MKMIKGKVKWGIIGVGDVCEKKSGPAFGKVPNSELVAVMRRNEAKAADFAHRHKVPKYFSDADEFLSDPEINAVYIATPPAFHEKYTLEALNAGKAVYVEKPVTLNSLSCRRMIEAERDSDLPVTAAHYRRALPLFVKVKEIINSGLLGNILYAVIQTWQSPAANLIAKTDENWRLDTELSGGGLFHDLAPHQLDLMCWYFGNPKKVNGQSTNQGGLYNAPDLSLLNAEFGKNIYLNGIWSFAVHQSAEREKCEVIGEKGKLVFSFFSNPELEVHTNKGVEKLEFSVPEHIQQPMIEQVVRYFRGERNNPCSLNDALESLQMMDATLR